MKHKIELNDTECLLVLKAMKMIVKSSKSNEADKNIASQIEWEVKNTVKDDKLTRNDSWGWNTINGQKEGSKWQ